MAGIGNIVGAYNLNPKRVLSKLTFELGQVFVANIIGSDELGKELILKLIDGWQFPAKLESPLDFVPEGLVRFQVEGFNNGKLQIKIVNSNREENNEKNFIEDFLLEKNIKIDKEKYEILEKMVRHNMPLTKDNISKISTVLDFKRKIELNEKEEDVFILRYLKNKRIEIDSEKGKKIESVLKGFFKELNRLSDDDIFTMFENNIDLTEENIKSFLKLSEEDNTIYKDLKNIDKKLEIHFKRPQVEELQAENLENDIISEKEIEPKDDKVLVIIKLLQEHMENEGLGEAEIELLKNLESRLYKADADVKKIINSEEKINNIISELQSKDTKVYKKLNVIMKKLESFIKPENNDLETAVKEQIETKTDEMKSIVKNLMEKMKSSDTNDFARVVETLKEYINDFKVFNSISGQYYYLDIPLNINKDEYKCKLLVKDDRKSGKRIDSENVSLVVSIKTINIGIVNVYVKVSGKNMYIDIKCDEQWINILGFHKNKLLDDLSNYGYSVLLNVDKKDLEANLTDCSGFFEDSSSRSINIRV